MIDSGTESVVFVALGDGKFQPREVQLGGVGRRPASRWSPGSRPGERVVTRANFLVDSESRLRASLAAWAASERPAASDAPARPAGPAAPPPIRTQGTAAEP